MNELPDPRRFPPAGAAEPAASALHALASRSLAAATAREGGALDEAIASALRAMLARRDGAGLASALDSAPTLAVYRHLWRSLSRLTGKAQGAGDGLGVTLFAIPVVVVAALANGAGAATQLSCVLPDVAALGALLREHRALSGNQSFALADALVSADAIDVQRLPELLASGALAAGKSFAPLALALPPAPIDVTRGERAHLRFVVGSALSAAGAELVRHPVHGRCGMPLAKSLTSQLSIPSASIVALPRSPESLPVAVAHGRAARRDVAAQLFASNALREIRASVGEPVAVISAHEAADAPGGGELRLSLSSPLSVRDAHGFQCPIYAGEHVTDVATMLVDLLRDCRVVDVRLVQGVHPDRDPLTKARLLFKPDTIPAAAGLRH